MVLSFICSVSLILSSDPPNLIVVDGNSGEAAYCCLVELSQAKRTQIFDAGSLALRFNAPLCDERVATLVEQFLAVAIGSVVDLGCGTGSLTRAVAAALPNSAVRGLDTNPTFINAAITAAAADMPTVRATFDVADASKWAGPDGGAICIGASHVFGGPSKMIQQLARGCRMAVS